MELILSLIILIALNILGSSSTLERNFHIQNGDISFNPFNYIADSEPCTSKSRGESQCVNGCGSKTLCREYLYDNKTDTIPVCKCDDENRFNWNLKVLNCGYVNWSRIIQEDFGMMSESNNPQTLCTTHQELAYQKCGLQCEVMKNDPNDSEGLYHGFLCLGQNSQQNSSNYTCECIKKEINKIEPDVTTYGLQDACPYSRFASSSTTQQDSVSFQLYTNSKNTNDFDKIYLNDVMSLHRYKVGRPLKILIHGYRSGPQQGFPQNMKNAYLRQKGQNILIIDWEDMAKLTQAFIVGSYYKAAVINAPRVGQRVAEMIEFLVQNSYTRFDLVHIVGHSLGAHVAGISGQMLGEWYPRAPIARISGLDPAGPHFYSRIGRGRPLRKGDARFIDVIHTDQFFWGRAGHIGNADFIPNGGTLVQESCRQNITNILLDIFTLGSCSHSAAHILFTNSIGRKDMRACRCPNYNFFIHGRCKCSRGSRDEAILGDNCSPMSNGNFFLQVMPCMEHQSKICG